LSARARPFKPAFWTPAPVKASLVAVTGEARTEGGGPPASLPNLLTMVRVAAIPALVWLLSDSSREAGLVAFGVFFVASWTDFFDGLLARRYGLVTALGKLLDPLADKLLVVSALIMLAMMDRSPGIPAWLVVIIIGRELSVTGLRAIAAAEGLVMAAEASGKLKMILQAVAVHALILHYDYLGIDLYTVGMVLLLLSTVVGLWSAAGYYLRVFRTLADKAGGTGPAG